MGGFLSSLGSGLIGGLTNAGGGNYASDALRMQQMKAQQQDQTASAMLAKALAPVLPGTQTMPGQQPPGPMPTMAPGQPSMPPPQGAPQAPGGPMPPAGPQMPQVSGMARGGVQMQPQQPPAVPSPGGGVAGGPGGSAPPSGAASPGGIMNMPELMQKIAQANPGAPPAAIMMAAQKYYLTMGPMLMAQAKEQERQAEMAQRHSEFEERESDRRTQDQRHAEDMEQFHADNLSTRREAMALAHSMAEQRLQRSGGSQEHRDLLDESVRLKNQKLKQELGGVDALPKDPATGRPVPVTPAQMKDQASAAKARTFLTDADRALQLLDEGTARAGLAGKVVGVGETIGNITGFLDTADQHEFASLIDRLRTSYPGFVSDARTNYGYANRVADTVIPGINLGATSAAVRQVLAGEDGEGGIIGDMAQMYGDRIRRWYPPQSQPASSGKAAAPAKGGGGAGAIDLGDGWTATPHQ